jgi:hypothetical protein
MTEPGNNRTREFPAGLETGRPARPNETFLRAGRAKFFVGPARPGVLFKFNVLYIYHKQFKLLKKFTKEKIFEFYIEIFKKT